MNLIYRLIFFLFIMFITGIFLWALFAPKEDISKHIYSTINEQAKKADLSFKSVTFEEVSSGVKYWKLVAESATVNKTNGLATLTNSKGTFYKKGSAVLHFNSPAALWDMKKKEIYLDKPLGYDISLERTINQLSKKQKYDNTCVFNLPADSRKDKRGYWFHANNLSWKFSSRKLSCQGNILLHKGEITGYGEKLEGDVGLENLVLEGNPRIIITPGTTSPITVEALLFRVNSPQNLLIAEGNPNIFWDKAVITSLCLKYFQNKHLLELSENVRIIYDDLLARGNFADYFTNRNIVILRGNAHATQGENKLSGEKVSVSLKDKKISLLGSGKLVINDETLKNK